MSTSTIKQETPAKTQNTTGALIGFVIVVALAFVARWAKYQVYGAELPFGVPGKVLEYPLWAALIGLIANYILKVANVYDTIKGGFRTELFLKIGLVLLGAGISFKVIVVSAGGAVLQGLVWSPPCTSSRGG